MDEETIKQVVKEEMKSLMVDLAAQLRQTFRDEMSVDFMHVFSQEIDKLKNQSAIPHSTPTRDTSSSGEVGQNEEIPSRPGSGNCGGDCGANLKPAKFDGTTRLVDYLTQFDYVAVANKWNDRQKAEQLIAALRGTALDCLGCLDSEGPLTFGKVRSALKQHFSVQERPEINHLLLKNKRQTRDESLAQHAGEVRRLARLALADCPADAVDRIAKMQFIDGILDVNIQDLVRVSNPDSLQEALEKALHVEACRKASRMDRHNARMVTSTPENRPAAPTTFRYRRRVRHRKPGNTEANSGNVVEPDSSVRQE